MRNRGKRALYEAMKRSVERAGISKQSERLHPEKYEEVKDSGDIGGRKMLEKMSGWPKRPKAIQINAGRIELSIPYSIAIVIALGGILVVVLAFRFGQLAMAPKQSVMQTKESMAKEAFSEKEKGTSDLLEESEGIVNSVGANVKATNRIVIQSWHTRAQLVPVQKYFSKKGIATEIREINNMYYLVTSEKFENPKREGTNGYEMRKKIVQLGADYKAPAGYGSFGPKPFHDAYGMRFDD